MKLSPQIVSKLEAIKYLPVKTAVEMSHAMQMISHISAQLDPMDNALIQLDVVIRHYNLNRVEGAEEMSMVDVLLKRAALYAPGS